MKLRALAVATACLVLLAPARAALRYDLTRMESEQLAQDQTWHALLHYRAGRNGDVRSQADRPSFFMSKGGARDARAELAAAVIALHTPQQARQLACRFPARYEWLRQRLGHTTADSVEALCPQLATWLAGFPGRRMSISFASSYLESPSSTFGHTFLRVYQHDSSELLSPTINYAARTEARDSELAFVVKGLAGGFPGVADELPFYRRLRTYADAEGRDIHEYDLALTPDEVRRILLHTWEIRDGVFDYYFIDENCAYRILALIDVARPHAGLLAQFRSATVPIDTIRVLRSAGMLGQHRVWPSGPRHVRELEARLSVEDSVAARRLARGVDGVDAFAVLPPQRRAAILQLAYEYGAVLIERDEGDRVGRKLAIGSITNARLAANFPPTPAPRAPVSPEAGHDGGLLASGVRRRGQRQSLTLEYAAFQHTLTNPLAGYEPHGEIRVLNPELEIADGALRLRRIDWLLVQSSVPATTLFAPRAWRVGLSTRDAAFADRDHVVTSLAYHSGKAWPLGRSAALTVMPGVSVEAGAAHAHVAALAASLRTAAIRQGSQWSAQLELRAEKFIAGSALRRTEAQLTAEIALARNVSLVATGTQHYSPRRTHEFGLSLQWRRRSVAGQLK